LSEEVVVAHPVVHFEIAGKEAKQTQRFYASLFDWEIDTQSMGEEYGTIRGGDGGIALGLVEAAEPGDVPTTVGSLAEGAGLSVRPIERRFAITTTAAGPASSDGSDT